VVEVADNEFNKLNREIPVSPEVNFLKALEHQYYKLATQRPDPELSLHVIKTLLPLYKEDLRQVSNYFQKFYDSHRETLQEVYERSAHLEDRSAFLFQPEALMIYDCLETDLLGTRELWNRYFPEQELERIANSFGISFD
jgi:hypothetical protein